MPLITEEQRFVFIAIDRCSWYRFVFPGYPSSLLAPPLMDFQKAQCTVSIISITLLHSRDSFHYKGSATTEPTLLNFSNLSPHSASQILRSSRMMEWPKEDSVILPAGTSHHAELLCLAIEYGIFLDTITSISRCSSVARINTSRNQKWKYYFS